MGDERFRGIVAADLAGRFDRCRTEFLGCAHLPQDQGKLGGDLIVTQPVQDVNLAFVAESLEFLRHFGGKLFRRRCIAAQGRGPDTPARIRNGLEQGLLRYGAVCYIGQVEGFATIDFISCGECFGTVGQRLEIEGSVEHPAPGLAEEAELALEELLVDGIVTGGNGLFLRL